MNLAPRLIAVSLVVGAALWSMAVVTHQGEPFGTDSAVLLAIGLLMFSLISAVGLLLPRGRWARNLATGILVLEVLLAIAISLDGWAVAALLATAAGIIGVQGRWLDGWLRRLPAAEGPSLEAMMFLLGALALTPAVALASPSGVEIRQGLVAAVGLLVAWGYSKAQLWGLWLARLGLAPLTLVAGWATYRSDQPAGAAFIVMFGLVLTWLAWQPATRLAIDPLLDNLPDARRLQPKVEEGN